MLNWNFIFSYVVLIVVCAITGQEVTIKATSDNVLDFSFAASTITSDTTATSEDTTAPMATQSNTYSSTPTKSEGGGAFPDNWSLAQSCVVPLYFQQLLCLLCFDILSFPDKGGESTTQDKVSQTAGSTESTTMSPLSPPHSSTSPTPPSGPVESKKPTTGTNNNDKSKPGFNIHFQILTFILFFPTIVKVNKSDPRFTFLHFCFNAHWQHS